MIEGKELLLAIIKTKGNCSLITTKNCATCLMQTAERTLNCNIMDRKDRPKIAIKLYIDKYGEDIDLLEVLI